MKTKYTFLFLILFTPCFTDAQQGKPTKEQTEEYIKQWFDNHYLCYNENLGYSCEWMTDNIQFQGDTVKLHNSFTAKKEGKTDIYDNRNYEIPLKKIEKVERRPGKISGLYYIVFTCSSSNRCISLKQKSSSLGGDSFSNMINSALIFIPEEPYNELEAEIEKLVKAFNHLRKLLDAPNPISFD
jgi:hypothetical protein